MQDPSETVVKYGKYVFHFWSRYQNQLQKLVFVFEIGFCEIRHDNVAPVLCVQDAQVYMFDERGSSGNGCFWLSWKGDRAPSYCISWSSNPFQTVGICVVYVGDLHPKKWMVSEQVANNILFPCQNGSWRVKKSPIRFRGKLPVHIRKQMISHVRWLLNQGFLRTLTLVVPFKVDGVSVFAVLGCFRSIGIPKFPVERLQVETPSWLAKSPSLQVESPTAPA